MNHVSEAIGAFESELWRALTPLSESIFTDAEQARVIHETFMERFRLLVTAHQAIEEKYRQLNAAPGNPASSVKTGAGGGYYRQYEHGTIYWHPQIGAHHVYGAIYQKYLQLNAEAGLLGYPLTDEKGTPDGVGRFNHFQGGSIYWTPGTGAWEVHGAIRDKWSSLGWEASFLGYPTTDETATPDGVGRFNHFQGGSIYWTPDIGAHEVHGLIRDRWAGMGWETSYLGYPLTDEHDDAAGRRVSRFERGVIVHFASSPHATDFPDTVILASGPLLPPEPITGWVELMINSAGFFSYRGHLHNSGFIGYHFAVASALHFQDPNGNVLAVGEEEHVGGTTSPEDSRDHEWRKNGFQQLIRDNWDAIKHSGMTTTLKVNATVGDVINAIVWSIPYALAAFVIVLVASGDAKVCDPLLVEDEDPFTHEKRRSIHVPIRFKDPEHPDRDPCR